MVNGTEFEAIDPAGGITIKLYETPSGDAPRNPQAVLYGRLGGIPAEGRKSSRIITRVPKYEVVRYVTLIPKQGPGPLI